MRAEEFTALADAARNGDPSALGHLLERFRPYLQLLAEGKLGQDLKQKCGESDLVQQTFLDAQKAFPRFAGSKPEELRAWLERILLNNLGDLARRYRGVKKRRIQREVGLGETHAEVDALADWSTPSKKVIAGEEKEKLRHALARLSADHRRVIVLRNLERRKFDDIAMAMGRSTEAVKKLWSRAILQLKEEMKEHEPPI